MGWMALAVTRSYACAAGGREKKQGWLGGWQGGKGGKEEAEVGELTLVLRLESELSPCGELWSSLDTTHRNSAWSSLP